MEKKTSIMEEVIPLPRQIYSALSSVGAGLNRCGFFRPASAETASSSESDLLWSARFGSALDVRRSRNGHKNNDRQDQSDCRRGNSSVGRSW